jgi:hypothetical protein
MSLTVMDVPLRLLNVKVVRSAPDHTQCEWRVFESDGTLLQSSTRTYAVEWKAWRDGRAAARKHQTLASSRNTARYPKSPILTLGRMFRAGGGPLERPRSVLSRAGFCMLTAR